MNTDLCAFKGRPLHSWVCDQKASQWLWLRRLWINLTLRYVKSCRGASWGVAVVVSGSGMCLKDGRQWVWETRHHPWAFWRCLGPNSMKHWWRKCLLENPSRMLTKLLLLYIGAQVRCLGSHVVFSSCGLQTAHVVLWRSLYGFRIQYAARVAAVTSQMWVVVSCCSGSMIGQLWYWLG